MISAAVSKPCGPEYSDSFSNKDFDDKFEEESPDSEEEDLGDFLCLCCHRQNRRCYRDSSEEIDRRTSLSV